MFEDLHYVQSLEKEVEEQTEMQCSYLEKYEEYENLRTELSKRTENIKNKLFNELSKKFDELEKQCVTQKTSVSRPQLRSTQMKDKVVPNNSQVKLKQTKVEDHHRISSFSNKINSITPCNGSLKSRTPNVKVVCATYGKCVFNSNLDACVSKFINDVNARTKKPKVVPIGARKPKRQANQSVATPHKKIVALESTIQKSMSYFSMLYENTSNA
uniref:Integrase, catalytic region, zinc finger, CCHC-type, peptidase aspartic, catalytic n=1 Tax=Tanacetum cinerariifolium TaxID=118510 RepID=A0A6L2P5M1_TANCI|nr:hypothetical protein [Tanacetum cinerariifolium]